MKRITCIDPSHYTNINQINYDNNPTNSYKFLLIYENNTIIRRGSIYNLMKNPMDFAAYAKTVTNYGWNLSHYGKLQIFFFRYLQGNRYDRIIKVLSTEHIIMTKLKQIIQMSPSITSFLYQRQKQLKEKNTKNKKSTQPNNNFDLFAKKNETTRDLILEVGNYIDRITDILCDKDYVLQNGIDINQTAPLTIPPFQFLSPEIKNTVMTIFNPNQVNAQKFEFSEDSKCRGCGLFYQKEKRSLKNSGKIKKAKNILNHYPCYSTCACKQLDWCVRCRVVHWIVIRGNNTTYRKDSNEPAFEFCITCTECTYYFGLANLFPVNI